MFNKQTAILRLVQLPYHTLNIEAAREIITIYLLSFACPTKTFIIMVNHYGVWLYADSNKTNLTETGYT